MHWAKDELPENRMAKAKMTVFIFCVLISDAVKPLFHKASAYSLCRGMFWIEVFLDQLIFNALIFLFITLNHSGGTNDSNILPGYPVGSSGESS